MIKNCLIIDDNKQDDIIERIIEKARQKGTKLTCYQFNVGSEERQDLLNNGNIDSKKVIEAFQKEFHDIKLDLICIDYQLEDQINGIDLLKKIYEHRTSSTYLIYSANIDQVTKEIIDNYDEDKDRKRLISRIKSLSAFRIYDFSSRERYDQVILDIVTKHESPLELLIEEKLLEYPDMVFKNTYPRLSGSTLKAIAKEIRINSYDGKTYKRELIDQAIAHMIEINK